MGLFGGLMWMLNASENEKISGCNGGGHSSDGERRAVAHARGAAGRIMAKGVDLNAGGLVLDRGERVGFEFDGSVHAGVVVTVNHHDFFGNEWSYDVLVDGDDGPMMYKNMTMERDRLRPLDGVRRVGRADDGEGAGVLSGWVG